MLRYQIEELIATCDTARIMMWLGDSSLVYQAYAAEAIIRMRKAGVVFPDRSTRKANELRKSRIQVMTCRGCQRGMTPLNRAMSQFLKLAKPLQKVRSRRNNEHFF
jgi:hypothetical protein